MQDFSETLFTILASVFVVVVFMLVLLVPLLQGTTLVVVEFGNRHDVQLRYMCDDEHNVGVWVETLNGFAVRMTEEEYQQYCLENNAN